jgi:putative phosphoribosyl transferase
LLKGEKRLELIVGATHLFEEPGTLELVAQRAQQWFAHYLRTEHLSHSGKKREEEQQTTILYQDRFDAGQQLVAHLHAYAKRRDVLVLALPRGGVPVAFAVARALHAPLDVFLVRKLGVPGEEELALGAIASGNIRVLNDEVVQARHLSQQVIEQVEQQKRRELARYEQRYRGDRPPPDLHDRIVILVDDGLATGASMRAAVQAVRKQQPARLVVAVPVADSSVCEALRKEVDEVVCAQTPAPLYGISAWYRDFAQVSDQEVHALLARAEQAPPVAERPDAERG